MSLIVSKRRASVFHKFKLKHLSNHTLSHNSKKALTKISQILLFFDFETDLDYFSTLRRLILQMFQLQIMIEKPRHDLLTLTTTFYDASVSRNFFSKAEMRQFGASGNQHIWDCREPTG